MIQATNDLVRANTMKQREKEHILMLLMIFFNKGKRGHPLDPFSQGPPSGPTGPGEVKHSPSRGPRPLNLPNISCESNPEGEVGERLKSRGAKQVLSAWHVVNDSIKGVIRNISRLVNDATEMGVGKRGVKN